MTKQLLAALFVLFALAACQRSAPATPDAKYLDAVSRAAQLLDEYGGDRRDLDKASELLARAMSEHPDLPHAYVESARLALKGGHIVGDRVVGGTLETATKMLDEAERLDPGYCETYSLRGYVLTQAKQLDAALAALDKADALQCPNPWRYANRADALVKMNRLADAEVVLKGVVERGPGKTTRDRAVYSSGLSVLASIAIARGDFDAARTWIHKDVEIARPDHPWDYSDAASQLVVTGDFDEAIELCERALKIFTFGAARATLATAQYGKSVQIETRLQSADDLSPQQRKSLQDEADELWRAASRTVDFREAAGQLWNSAANRDLGFRAVLTEHARRAASGSDDEGEG